MIARVEYKLQQKFHQKAAITFSKNSTFQPQILLPHGANLFRLISGPFWASEYLYTCPQRATTGLTHYGSSSGQLRRRCVLLLLLEIPVARRQLSSLSLSSPAAAAVGEVENQWLAHCTALREFELGRVPAPDGFFDSRMLRDVGRQRWWCSVLGLFWGSFGGSLSGVCRTVRRRKS